MAGEAEEYLNMVLSRYSQTVKLIEEIKEKNVDIKEKAMQLYYKLLEIYKDD